MLLNRLCQQTCIAVPLSKARLRQSRKRQTSDVVTAAEVEQEVHLRKAQQRKAEADEERLKAEEEEGIEVLIEEELGQNPESGEGWTEYNFQAARLPKETYALGIVELVPELYSSGKSFCLLEPGAGLVVKELQLRSAAGGRLNCFSLTLWFRVPNLPLKADRLIFLDFPRQSNDPQQFDTPEEEQNTGKLFIWKNGIIAPEGCHEPRILSKKKRRNQASRGTPAALATGEWQLRFSIQAHGKAPASLLRPSSAEIEAEAQDGQVRDGQATAQGAAANAARVLTTEPSQGLVAYTVQITCDANSGALRVRPARGNRLASGGSGEEIFTVIVRLTDERRRLIKDEMGGREGDDNFISKRLWKKHLKSLVSGLGRSFEALGFPGGKRHFKATLYRKLKETGDEAIVAVRQTEDAAAAIADQLRSTGALAQEPEAMEDRTFAGVPKPFDTVMLCPDANDNWGPLRNGATGEIGTIDNYGEALVYVPSRAETNYVHWYCLRDIMLATKGGKEALMTLEEWQQMPSVRANYVSLEPPGPPPSPIVPGNQWAARGRLDARNLQLDLEGEGGRSVAYADASLVIEEGQVPELQGTWRAEDGSYGTFEGLKVCRESRIGGVWRLEIQADSEGDARASHLLRITGAALAGPFLSEKETVERHPTLMGEFNSLTRSLHVEMSSEGEKWDGLILDAELGTDGALRGAWQRGEQSGRWIARHIGKKNTQGTFKPQVDEGGKWDSKACIVKTNLQMISTRPQPGDKVKLSKAYKQFDGEDGCLKPGQIGTLVEDDRLGLNLMCLKQ
ncbi:Hypothetical protein (Fragment) [Durusdinium trenchii]|uniref:Uncharacterized protein n=1 Tax=Durusdinium trenchii TaxID=1381693 RepID=A0ABP0IQ24_9DINO